MFKAAGYQGALIVKSAQGQPWLFQVTLYVSIYGFHPFSFFPREKEDDTTETLYLGEMLSICRDYPLDEMARKIARQI